MNPHLPDLEQFPSFLDLPEFVFSGEEPTAFANLEIQVQYLTAGKYIVYRITYLLIPNDHPDRFTFLIYDAQALKEKNQKVYKVFDRQMNEIGLSRATYDIGILFSGGRVFADGHFLTHFK